MAFCDDVERNIRVKCCCGILHFTFDDVMFVRVNSITVIRIVGEIYDKMIRFSRNKDLIFEMREDL